MSPNTKTRPMSEARKIRKPLMERKRRERINLSLDQLATLLKESKMVKNSGSKNVKLEKADILELTVEYLQKINTKKSDTVICDKKYAEGFEKCMGVVESTINNVATSPIRKNVMKHLQSYLESIRINKDPDKMSVDETDLKDVISNASEVPQERDVLTLIPSEHNGKRAFILKGDPNRIFTELQNNTKPEYNQDTQKIDCNATTSKHNGGYNNVNQFKCVSLLTPPPSPPAEVNYKPVYGQRLYYPGVYQEGHSGVQCVQDVYMEQPYDLRLKRVWRPW